MEGRRGAMRGPKPAVVDLSAKEREELERLTRRYGTPQQIALRGRIVLQAGAGLNNAQIGRELGLNVDTVRLWRQRWLGFQGMSLADMSVEARLRDAARPGRPAQITPEQEYQIVEMACEAPDQSGRPISQWTGREVAEEAISRGIVVKISPRHASRLLKKTR